MFRRAKVFATQIEVKLTFSIGTTLFTALYLPSIKQIVQPHFIEKRESTKTVLTRKGRHKKEKEDHEGSQKDEILLVELQPNILLRLWPKPSRHF
jgi:hypothetical protein